MMQVTTRINGVAVDCVVASDRGLLYGDGLFETIAVHDGQAACWSRHMTRLLAGCERLGIPAVDTDRLAREAEEMLEGAGEAVLKVIVTRGSGGRGYRAPDEVVPRRILQLHPWPDFPPTAVAEGVATRICTIRLCHNPVLAGIKHLNRLEQVLARREWDAPQIGEGLLLDSGGRLIEGTMSNLFLVRDRVLLTPDLRRCGVAGIMRSIILDHAEQQSLTAEIRALDIADLQTADEVFICNSLIGIWPVIAIDDRLYRKGVITKWMQKLIQTPEDNSGDWRI